MWRGLRAESFFFTVSGVFLQARNGVPGGKRLTEDSDAYHNREEDSPFHNQRK